MYYISRRGMPSMTTNSMSDGEAASAVQEALMDMLERPLTAEAASAVKEAVQGGGIIVEPPDLDAALQENIGAPIKYAARCYAACIPISKASSLPL